MVRILNILTKKRTITGHKKNKNNIYIVNYVHEHYNISILFCKHKKAISLENLIAFLPQTIGGNKKLWFLYIHSLKSTMYVLSITYV